ncbi:MAG: S9 family peptidase [Acidimicrobiales bacterium]|nr:S9 family peptidase [Acidimicrobiales bacterium]
MAPVEPTPAGPASEPAVPAPPPTRRLDLVETLHGIEVADPYRWLEADDDPEVTDWVAAQNARSRALLDALPGRDAIRARLLPLLQAPVTSAPRVKGDRVFTVDRGGDREQAVLCVRPALGATPEDPRVLVDPAALLGDATAALDWYHPSPDGRLVAFGLSTGGDEQSTLHLLDVDEGELLADVIPHARAASVAWLPDGSAFAYARYPDPATVAEGEEGYGRHLCWHVVGTDPTLDPVVFPAPEDRTAWPDGSLSDDGRWLLVHVAYGWSRVDVHLHDREAGTWRVVSEGVEAVNGFAVVGDRLVGSTTVDADRGRIVAAALDQPGVEDWTTLVPEGDAVIEGFVATPASLLVASTRHAEALLTRYDLDGSGGEPVTLPETGSLAGLSGSSERDEAFFAFTSFTRPAQLFRWSRAAGVAPWSEPAAGLEPDAFTVERLEYPSTDGAAISMFVVRRQDTVPSPDTRTALTGYGGFGVTMSPVYSPAAVEVAGQGGCFAVACLRGGAEEGEAWHQAGTRERKQQVFDDFHAAADWLVEQGRTSRERLAIRGGSNGGLLVGAALTQRPDLCAAVHCAVPLLDMVRFHRFLIARLWIPEYGDPDEADDLAWLHAYSPYHRVVDGTCYPAVLLTSGEGDSRVHPMHARKMAARLQRATSCGEAHPVLLQIEARAGHGQGKPVGMQADELADVLAFFGHQLAGE